jgi:hypothetical protein
MHNVWDINKSKTSSVKPNQRYRNKKEEEEVIFKDFKYSHNQTKPTLTVNI